MSAYHHVRKEDLRPRSATVVDPPFESYDVVERQVYDNAMAALLAMWQRFVLERPVENAVELAQAALSSEDATRPTGDKA